MLRKTDMALLFAAFSTLGLAIARADEVNLSTSLNNLPIATTIFSDDPKYHDALFKAQEAFFKQTGFSQGVDNGAGIVVGNVRSKATTFIDGGTPFNSKQILFVGVAAYSILVKKQVTQKFKDPVFHSVTHTFSANRNSCSTGIQMPLPF